MSSTHTDSIYGVDDREFVTKKSDKKIQELAQSVALIVDNDSLEKALFKTVIKAAPLSSFVNLCIDEKFSKAMSLSGCTGFLVDSDKLVTAGHCFESDEDCTNKKIVFDVDAQKQIVDGYRVNTKNIFSCKKIIKQSSGPGLPDYAVIELDRKTLNRPHLVLNTKKRLGVGVPVFMIGHPMGMPLVLSKKTPSISVNTEYLFGARLDAFQGNSGSPVFNAETLEVEGILVNGQDDLVHDPSIECYRNMTYDNVGNEGVFRSTEIPAF